MENIREVIDKMPPLDPISYMLAKKAQRNLRIHKASVPIDHLESSILFAHLAKEVKEEFLRLALSTLMNRALLNAETKDFYVILADVITTDYPLGYYETIERKSARTPITITEQSGNDLSDYAVKIELDDTWDGWDLVIDGSDIYFLDDQGNPLYYWIEEFDKTNKHAVIWVKIPSLPANSSITIYMHCGGDNPYSAYHDPEQVFKFFDDFSTLDPNKWTELAGDWDVQDGYLTVISDYGMAPGNVIYSSYYWDGIESIAIETRIILGNVNAGIVIVNDPSIKKLEGYFYSPPNDRAFHNYYDGSEWGSETVLWTQTYNTGDAIRGRLVLPSGVFYDLTNNKSGTKAPVYGAGYIGFHQSAGFATSVKVDWIAIRPYVEPEPSIDIGASEFTGIETTNLQFPDGIDKILVTIDSDAQEVYYSTDGGQTWNPLTLDEEILLPETAYQLKLKFSNFTYFRGYALIGW